MSDKPTSSQYPLYQADNGVTPAAVRFAASAVRLAQPLTAPLYNTTPHAILSEFSAPPRLRVNYFIRSCQ